MENGTSDKDLENVAARSSAASVATPQSASPLVSQIKPNFTYKPYDTDLQKLRTQKQDANELSTSPPSSSSSSTSGDKTDNHETYVFYPDTVDMRREEDRLKSFDKWPVTFLTPALLAKNGFYYLGRGDEVRCAFCKVEVMKWVPGDEPAKDHQKYAPQCPFIRKDPDTGNVPLPEPILEGRDECGTRAPATSPLRMPGPAHPRYTTEGARLRSFAEWPRSMKQKPEELAEAGFFYTGQGDKTKCFYCDGGLKDWENDDIPWEQHARWFDRCAYVQLVKGKEYIQRVITEAYAIPAEKKAPAPVPAIEMNSTPEDDEKTEEEDSKLCKICYAEERNVCFIPCGHVVACAKCALSTNKCPMCRRTFHNAVRLYFS